MADASGVVFLLNGIGGFIPGLTPNYDRPSFAPDGPITILLGLFMVSISHNIGRSLFGIAGLALTRTPGSARTYLIGGGLCTLC